MFGSFVEHMGRCVYGGIYDPGHESADEDGFRADVLELVRELGVTMVRYPGGNFVSGYRWEDGVGPADERATRLDLAWRTTETNAFGLNEFMRWARKADVEPMMAMNLGTRGVHEAVDLLEYCNHPGGTTLSGLRAEHGTAEPHGVRLWCLGNELDGPWQLGAKTAAEYGRLAATVARALRQYDPDLELVACGSSNRQMPTFGSWEATVLEETYDVVDMISAHAYYEVVGDDVASFLASSVDMDRFIDDVVATADHVGAKRSSTKRIDISFDEWNVWYNAERKARGFPVGWPQAPRISEDDYTVADAVVVGSLLITLVRHSDRVAAACQAQLVNTIGSIRTEPEGPAWRQTIFYPFAHVANAAKGVVLSPQVDAPTVETARYGPVLAIDTVATFDEATGDLTVFAVNRDPSQAVDLDVSLAAFDGATLERAVLLADDDWRAANTRQDPERVVPVAHPGAQVVDGELRASLPPASWNVFSLRAGRRADQPGD
ncbi:alpha-N-arabinofuranosidase [uncultured Cellulomonas sp.]|uniref:arabinosylfuranosidase ArfA n=1 Tax=uncultured Cellulomonas sp. TaxID=189682 RepID=UPI00260C4EE2|nr:alpha-N-arabinofuranosidase [uncultured Cellulomonas sp.]